MSTDAQTACAPKAEKKYDAANDYHIARRLNTQMSHMASRNGHTVVGSRPLILGFDISSVCNANCIFCLGEENRRRKSDIDAFRSPEWMDNFSSLLPFINLGVFSSYEALLNPQFDKFVLKLRESYTPFQVFTNGKAMDGDMAEFCLENGLHSLHWSMHSPDPKTYEGIMRGLSYDETLGNLMRLKHLARKINPHFTLVLVFCAMRRNIEQLPDFVELAHRVGAKAIQVNYLMVTNEKHKLDHESLFFNQDLYDRYVTIAKHKGEKLGVCVNHQPFFSTCEDPDADSGMAPCYKPWEYMFVEHSGEVSMCCGGVQSPGNIIKEDFFDVWNGKQFQKYRRFVNSDTPPKKCQECSRGRENPKDVLGHLTYLNDWSEEDRNKRLDELYKRFQK